MQLPSGLAKVLAAILAVLVPVLSWCIGLGDAIFVHTEKETAQVLETAGGFMTGVCHPEPAYDEIKGANLGWIREDLRFPFDENGELSQGYLERKAELQRYAAQGIKVMAITPYPEKFRDYGLDIRNEADIPAIQEIARFFVEDLRGIVSAFQVTNEMGVDRFTLPLTMEEAAKFIGVQLEAMYPIRGDILLGYNLGGTGILKLPPRMKAYNKYVDYVGVDLYFGCFENIVKSIEIFPAILKFVHQTVKKPVVLTEFGYIGYGEPKTAAEKTAILQKYGVSSESEARKDINAFIAQLPPSLREEFTANYSDRSDEEKANLLFQGEYANHIYCELAQGVELKGYPHTPEGQAKFYTDLIPKLKKLKFCVGAFIYMWNDSEACYVCGQSDCPVETGWGLIDGAGNRKPAYDAVKAAFAS